MTAPISASAVSTRRCPRCSGVSRTTRISGRPSFRVTSAARDTSVSLWQDAMAAAVRIEHGAMTIPSVRKEPEAMEAPMSRTS